MANNIFGIKHKCETGWPGWPTAQKASVDHWSDFQTFSLNLTYIPVVRQGRAELEHRTGIIYIHKDVCFQI